MSWVERTFEEVEPPDETSSETNVQLEDMLRNLPPYMKIKTRRARKALARYETRKQKYIENLRQNALYKFVMQVAAFTNEDIQKYWKGKSLTPFIEEFSPEPIAISKEDLDLTYQRAKENAYSDLHQFCRRIRAIPMFEWGTVKQEMQEEVEEEDAEIDLDEEEAVSNDNLTSSPSKSGNSPFVNMQVSPATGVTSTAPVDSAVKPATNRALPESQNNSVAKFIYNMTDIEFEEFCAAYVAKLSEEKNVKDFLLCSEPTGSRKAKEHKKPDGTFFDGKMQTNKPLPALENEWKEAVPIIRWDVPYAEFWFQRYVARWLVDKFPEKEDSEDPSLARFLNRYRAMFNNVVRGRDGVYYRDLTGMSFTYKASAGNGDQDDDEDSDSSGTSMGGFGSRKKDRNNESEISVYPFAKPLFDQRVEWWRHELVLGEYEKRSMVQADQWLQKTPWALGKIYLEPSLYGHMIEAHTAIMTKFKKFSNVKLEDLVRHERHSYFLSKLVAMCIRTSAILSGKKYGLDKAYMRVNLEKRRLLYAWSKLEPPRKRTRRTYCDGRQLPEDYMED